MANANNADAYQAAANAAAKQIARDIAQYLNSPVQKGWDSDTHAAAVRLAEIAETLGVYGEGGIGQASEDGVGLVNRVGNTLNEKYKFANHDLHTIRQAADDGERLFRNA